MCLKTYGLVPLIAKEDIKVYKVLNIEYNSVTNEEYYVAPFYNYYKYKKGRKHHPIRIVGEYYGPHESTIDDNRYLDRGWLHAYTLKSDAKIYTYESKVGGRFVAEMIIPKGAEYYISFDGSEICTDTLIWND